MQASAGRASSSTGASSRKTVPNSWNWFHHPLDQIDREIAGGREVVGLLSHTVAYATDGPEGAGVPRGLYLPVDDPGNLWAVFVREVVTAYQGHIHRWVIWNEPDISMDTYGTQWAGTVADYYQLVKVASLAAHEVDPTIQIHLGGLTYWHNPDYLREFLAAASEDPTAAANGDYFDVVSLHVYFRPETTLTIVAALRQALTDYGLDKPIWINETNAPPYDDPFAPWVDPVFSITQQMQASFLLQEYALALGAGVERIEAYKWIDEPPPQPGFEPYGLVRSDLTFRPAYYAFRVITSTFADTTAALDINRPQFHQVILARGAQTTRVLWSRVPSDLTVSVPALAGSATLVNQEGDQMTIYPQGGAYTLGLNAAPCQPDTECLMGGRPLVLVEDAPTDLDDWPALNASIAGAGPDGSIAEGAAAADDAPPPPASSLLYGAAPDPLLILGAALALIVLGGAAAIFGPRHAA